MRITVPLYPFGNNRQIGDCNESELYKKCE